MLFLTLSMQGVVAALLKGTTAEARNSVDGLDRDWG